MNDVPLVVVRGLAKTFTLHQQGGLRLPVLADVSFDAQAGACVVLDGPSGTGKSTLMRCIYGNYRSDAGEIRVRSHDTVIDVAHATPRDILALRRHTIGYVSQFLRVIPRVPALDIVAEPLLARGSDEATAHARAGELLERLRIPARLWPLPPATFSGGEQQRVNIARGFAARLPILLLDEPTAALDAENRRTVVSLVREAMAAGSAVIGIFHDAEVRDALATVRVPLQ